MLQEQSKSRAWLRRTSGMAARDDRRWIKPPALSISMKIDLCRGLFAYLVVVAHALDVAWVVHPGAEMSLPPTLRLLLARSLGSGFFWVMGFFVISGYCIHLSVNRLMKKDRFPLSTYLLARLTRILPLYYLALLFTVLVERVIPRYRPGCWFHGINGRTLFFQIACVQNLTETFGSFASSWSVTNELLYYIFYGLLACAAFGSRRRPAWIGLFVSVLLAAGMQVLYVLEFSTGVSLSVGLLFGLGINWFLGALVAAHEDSLRQSRLASIVSRSWPLLVAASVGLWADGRCPLQVVYLLSGFAFTLMLIRFGCTACTSESKPRFRDAIEAVTKFLGLSSYPTYLFHGPVIMLVGYCVLRWHVSTDWRLTWALMVASGVGSGMVLGIIAEHPLMQWRADLLQQLKNRPAVVLSRRRGTVRQYS